MEKFEDTKLPLITHLTELKKRLIYSTIFLFISFIVSYFFSKEIYQILMRPLVDIIGSTHKKMIYTNLTEAFFTYLKLAFFTSFFASLPFCASQIYIFLAPGLYKNEKKALIPYLIAAPVLFALGAFFVYYFIFPLAWKFFLSFETNANEGSIPIQLEAKISEYLSLVMHLIIAFGMAFQLPVILILLVQLKFIKVSALISGRRFAIVFIFIIAAIITPPDALSQISLAIPMILLYEIAIIIGKIIEKQRVNSHA
ncbi:MAG: twin-arginine translocase subunit TatC [Alphaproteobacteria bacterium]